LDNDMNDGFMNLAIYSWYSGAWGHVDKYNDEGNRLSRSTTDDFNHAMTFLMTGGNDGSSNTDGQIVDEVFVCKSYVLGDAPAFRTPGQEAYYSIIREDVTASLVEKTTATISSELWNNANTTVGFWLGNESVNATNFLVNYTTATNQSGSNIEFSESLTGLWSGEYYYFRAWALEEGDFFVNATFDGTFLTKPNAPTALAQTGSGPNFINLSWTKPTVNVTNITTMIRYGILTYPTNVTQGTLAYNETNSWANITNLTADTNYYFSAWTYINASGSPFYWWYSDLYGLAAGNTTGGAYNVSIRWECNGTLVNLSGLSNSFSAYLADGTVLNSSNPQDADGTFSFDAPIVPNIASFTYNDGPTRTIVVDPTSQNITIYIPCGSQGTGIGDWADVTIHIVDYSGLLTPENNAIAYLYKYNVTSRQYIHMDYLQADMTIRPYLTLGDTYYIGVGCDVFVEDNLGPLTITEAEYFVSVYYTTNQSTFWDDIFETEFGWAGNTLYFDFVDTSHTGAGGVINSTIQLYYVENDTLIEVWYPLVAPWDFNYTYAGLNTTFNYQICLTVRYNTTGDASENWNERRCMLIFGNGTAFIDDPSFVNRVVSQILGESPVTWEGQSVAWTSMVAAFLSIYVFFTLSERYAGFGVMLVGFVMGIMKFPLGLITNDVFNWVAVTLVVSIGILMVLRMKKRS